MTLPPGLSVDRSISVVEHISAIAIICAAMLTLFDTLSGHHMAALVALFSIVVYVIAGWPAMRSSSRITVLAAAAAAVFFVVLGGGLEALALAASRAIYLPALLAVMTLLRVAAQQSRQVQTAAHFVVDQPPRRRFWLLTAGGHIFGVLLNVGGLQFLLRIALAGTVREKEDAAVTEIRTRRITNAVMRGFVSTVLWSPVGVAINLVIPLMPTMSWVDYLPYGLGMMVLFLFTGWIFDFLEPKPKARITPTNRDGGVGAVFMLLGLVFAITGSAAMGELIFGIPIRAAILIVVPLSAVLWTVLTGAASPRASTAMLGINGYRALPSSVSEICIMASTSFLGLLLAEMIPMEFVQALVSGLNAGPGVIACLIVLVMPLLSIVGVNPFITGTVIVGSLTAAGVPIPEPMLMAAALSGWCSAMTISPVTATVAIAAGAAGKGTDVIGLRWNGLFAIAFAGISMGVFLIWGSFVSPGS